MAEEKRKRPVIDDGDDEDEDIAPVVEEEPVGESVEEPVEEPVEDEEEQQDIGDLFGDDDADQQQEQEHGSDDEGEDDAENQFLVQAEEEQREVRIGEDDIVRHPPKFAYGTDTYLAKVPRFLHVNPSRFDANEYLKQVENLKGLDKDEMMLKRLHDENTIRWRYTKLGNETLTAESNAQFVEWEDGSFSLKLGDEFFDVLESSLNETFLTTFDNESEVKPTLYIADGSVNKTMKLVPTSTNSKIHKSLSVIKSRQTVKPQAQSVVVEVDPEKEARRLEKQFDDRVRERRRAQQKLEQEQEKSGAGSVVRSSYSRESYVREEDYDEEDGFIDDDEEEEELEDVDENVDEDSEAADDDDDDDATERLQKVKQQGAAQYDQEVQRKKRRVIEESDEE